MSGARANGHALAAVEDGARDPRVLAGGTYCDRRSGLTVRVLDSEYSATGPTGRFVVESADSRRPGARWICLPHELVTAPDEQARPEAGPPATVVAVTRAAIRAVERLLAKPEAVGRGEDVARLAVEMRAVADKLAAVAQAALAAREGGRT